MNSILGELAYIQIAAYRWRIYENFTYRLGSPDGVEFVSISKGFETDFASIPRPLWVIWPPAAGLHSKPAVIHDCLYKTGFVSVSDGSVRHITRQEADDIFKEAMAVAGVSWLSRRLIYRGVRVGGRSAWNKHRKAD